MTGTTRSTKTATAPAAPKANRRGTATPPAPVDGLAALQAAASAVAAAGKVKAPKAEAIKAQARRDLAQLLVSAYASAFSEIPADSPIFVALGPRDRCAVRQQLGSPPAHNGRRVLRPPAYPGSLELGRRQAQVSAELVTSLLASVGRLVRAAQP
jgi:hypothetical protein